VSALSPSPGESLELYGAPTGNCRRAAIALSEAGLAYAVRTVGLAGGEHRGEAFLALNPAGKVPVLVAGTARGAAARVLTQSNAIVFFAADRAPGRLLPAEGDGTRVRVLEAFFHFVTDVIGVNGAAFTLQRLGLPDAAAVLTERYLAAIAGSERFLGESGFMGGDACSIADIAGFTIVSAVADRLEWDRLPRLSAWRERIGRRPAVQAGMAAFDMLAATP
jgi:GST-like protein